MEILKYSRLFVKLHYLYKMNFHYYLTSNLEHFKIQHRNFNHIHKFSYLTNFKFYLSTYFQSKRKVRILNPRSYHSLHLKPYTDNDRKNCPNFRVISTIRVEPWLAIFAYVFYQNKFKYINFQEYIFLYTPGGELLSSKKWEAIRNNH